MKRKLKRKFLLQWFRSIDLGSIWHLYFALLTLQIYTNEKYQPHTFNFPHLPPLYLLFARMLQLCDEKQVSDATMFYPLQTLLAYVSSGVWRVARILARPGSASSLPRRRATGTRTAWWSRGRCDGFHIIQNNFQNMRLSFQGFTTLLVHYSSSLLQLANDTVLESAARCVKIIATVKKTKWVVCV